jgi:glycosyltransferase involved in cell wall biosynthesis
MTLSIIIPTIGRDTLPRALRSLLPQLAPGDEVLVVGDGVQPYADAVCAGVDQVRYLETPETHCFGNAQRQAGMAHATGDALAFLDDDDVARPRALAVMRAALAQFPDRVLICRFIDQHGLVLWRTPAIVQGNVSTQQIVVPNRPNWIGTWGDRYEGDLDFIQSTVARWPGGAGAVGWVPNVIADFRPCPR